MKTRSNFIDETGHIYGTLTVIGPIRRPNDRKTMWQCLCSCGNEIICSGSDLRTGRRSSCGKHCNNIVQEKSGTIYGFLKVIEQDKTPAQEFADQCVHWKCKCLLCGNEVSVSGKSLRNGDTTSCGCIKSRGEQYILQFLQTYKYNYVYQQKFSNLISDFSNLQLSYDFGIYTKDWELNYLLEFQGGQHFQQVSYFGNKLEKIQHTDQQKEQYCLNNNIKLLRINVKDADRVNYANIEKIILEFEKEIKSSYGKIFDFYI